MTPRSPAGWTLDTLAKYLADKIEDTETRTKERFELSKLAVDAALAASEKAINAAMAAAEKAVTKAETAAEKRFDGVNEFRAAMKDQTISFADKTQTDFRLSAVERKIDQFTGNVQGVNYVWVWFVSAVALVSSLAFVIGKFVK